MLLYPKMAACRDCPGGHCLAFEKYDGTNLHGDWDRDFGWHGFGTCRDQFNLTPDGIEQFARTHEHLREVPDVFLETLAEGVEPFLRDNAHYRLFAGFKVFTEFLGLNTFARLFKAGEPKRLVLRVGNLGVPDLLAASQSFKHLVDS